MDISGLVGDSNLLAGFESGEISATANSYDVLINVDPIKGHASTAPALGQKIELWVWGADTSLPTTAWDALDGTTGTVTLNHDAAKFAMCNVASPAVTAISPVSLYYPILPFSLANCFGGVVPDFWGLFLVHNHNGALDGTQSGLFSYQIVTPTT